MLYKAGFIGDICSLTFRFSKEKFVSPPVGTYEVEPDKEKAVPDKKVALLEFKSFKTNTGGSHLQQINMLAEKGENIFDISPSQKMSQVIQNVELTPSEHIVGAEVHAGKFYSVKLTFLIFVKPDLLKTIDSSPVKSYQIADSFKNWEQPEFSVAQPTAQHTPIIDKSPKNQVCPAAPKQKKKKKRTISTNDDEKVRLQTLKIGSLEILKSPGFFSFSPADVLHVAVEQLMLHRLSHIMYEGGHPDIPVLTFRFTDHSFSPPMGTYSNATTVAEKVPDRHVNRVEVKSFKDKFGYLGPFSLVMFDGDDEKMVDITRSW